MKLDIDSAVIEVSTKSDKVLEEETAFKWASRACACYQRFCETGDKAWLLRADSYSAEALEHAALVRDCGATVGVVEAQMTEAMSRMRLICETKGRGE